MPNQNIRPEALAAGVMTLLGAAILYRRSENVCKKFSEIWKEEGPIHLKQSIQNKAFTRAAEKIRSSDAANETLTRFQLQKYLADHFAPRCDWDSRESDRAKKIWTSFGDIADYSLKEFYDEGGSGG
jgi:hypothetical protein